jgi:valyl-tRNA synthetase
MEKTFDPQAVEARIYASWEASGAFQPQGEGEAFSIVIPPPNVTGSLHIGHALNNTLQDVLIRYKRKQGYRALWQPGTDHAGIATQMVVERQLVQSGSKEDRRSLGREAFIERIWAWKEKSGGRITEQLKRLGASCDWSAERFTMDEGLSKAVRRVFVQLYREGLIYRAKRLVNWDPHFQTAISDLEVETREVDGLFWHLRYPLADGVTYQHPILDEDGKVIGHERRDHIVVATTRPETMLGDTGVAVHPDDERYAGLVGKFVELPIVGRRIPIVADAHADPGKGSGAVKITPAHDFNDYGVGERAGLPALNILTAQAAIVGGKEADAAGIPEDLRGLDRFEARKVVIEVFESLGLLCEIEARKIEQPFGDRSGVVIEPWLTDQWFCDAATLAKPAIEAVTSGRTRFVPENWSKTYFNWMENIQPWCVSRQLWWGHRIPVWYGPNFTAEGHFDPDHPIRCFVAESEEEAAALAAEHYGPQCQIKFLADEDPLASDPSHLQGRAFSVGLKQDGDVLDTWFSSALWPFSTQGWPENTEALKTFYPTNVLITAFDIIFFWVARMMMQGLHFMNEVPFRDVYIHALVRDEHGQKMSKSKGNVIDPLELIDELGADALRFTLCAMAAQGRDIRLSKARIEGYRNFHTKIWNAARFLQMNGVSSQPGFDAHSAKLPVNLWVLGELRSTITAVSEALDSYRFNDAADTIYRFGWNTYCDWYVELIKPVLNGEAGNAAQAETAATAAYVFDQMVGLLHPFSPFITEELWHVTALTPRDAHLILSPWPDTKDLPVDAVAIQAVSGLIDLVTAIRSVRADMSIPPAAKAALLVVAPDAEHGAELDNNIAALERLARCDGWKAVVTLPADAVQILVGGREYGLPLGDLIDLHAEAARLTREQSRLAGEIKRLEGKLSNDRFVANAAAEIVEAERAKLAEYLAEAETVAAAHARIAGIL